MFLTLTAVAGDNLDDARDLGYLLHKHPDRAQVFDLSVGRAHVFFPEATTRKCTAALLLDVDPIGLVRNKRFGGSAAFALSQYVNDRPYAASSMVSVALRSVFGTALAGRCESRPDLVRSAIPLEIHIPALPCRGGSDLAHRLFQPLGWQVEATTLPLDPHVPRWGDSRYVDLHLSGPVRLADALNQIYVLLPVLDDAKHYWVTSDEIDKLMRAGAEWLTTHPERDLITARYLAHQRRYVTDATARLSALDDMPDAVAEGVEPAEDSVVEDLRGQDIAPLHRRRADAVLQVLADHGATSVVDLGCGEGTLLRRLMVDRRYTRLLGADVSARALERAAAWLHMDDASDAQRERVRLIQSSVTYVDNRIAGYDAVVLMEVIEHLDPSRLEALERAVLGHARPRIVVVTTPNVEYNVNYPGLDQGRLRHPDHRFEWTREEFGDWCRRAGARFGYDVELRPVGHIRGDIGGPTQMAIFVRATDSREETA